MSRIDKINYFKRKAGVNDDNIAENYLNFTDWNQDHAVQLYLNVNQSNQNNRLNNSQLYNSYAQNYNYQNVQQNPGGKIEFKLNQQLLLNKEVCTSNNHVLYEDLKKFLFEKFIYLSYNFKEFFEQLKKHAGLIIVLSKEKVIDVRNNLIKASNNSLCTDIITNAVIFPIMNNSRTGIELIRKCSPRSYPLYLFCKYKNRDTMIINFRVENQFRIDNVVNNLLECFPEEDIKQSLFQSINRNIEGLKRSIRFDAIGNNNNLNNQNNVNIQDNNNAYLSDPDNYFSGSFDELLALISNLEKNKPSNIVNNNSEQNQNNNIDYNVPRQNNINNNEQNISDSNRQQIINSINNNYSQIQDSYNYNNRDFNNQSIHSQISNNNSINQSNINNPNINNNINNSINKSNNNNIQHSLNQNNQSIKDSIYGLSAGEVMAKREREMKELERQHEEKIRKEEEEKKKKLEEESKMKMRDEKYEKEAELSKQNLPVEPDENNPDVCKIMFRYSSGEKSSERRFLKTDKIIILYNYVKSLGREIYTEPKYNDFDLISGFPPKNLENSKDKTLLEEGLFPSSMIQIKEK